MMKKCLLLYALALLVSCQGIEAPPCGAIYSKSLNQEFPFQTFAHFAQELIIGSFSSFPKVNELPVSKLVRDKPKYILIEVVPDLMKYDTDSFTVTAGEKVILDLDNPDGMQHNLLIAKPGTLEKVGAAADAMLRDPKAAEKHYVPEIPEILFATKMVDPGDIFTLEFTAPSVPGNYPFVCTFPGHWRMMNGIMKVEKKQGDG